MRIAIFGALFLLSACFEAETVLSINANKQVEARASFLLARMAFDSPMFSSAGGADLCAGGKLIREENMVTCTMSQRFTFAEVNQAKLLGDISAKLEEKSGEIVRISLPLRDLLGEAQTYRSMVDEKLQNAGFNPKTAGKFLGGLELIIAIEAHQIIKTNGVKSEDGTRAEIAIPLADLIDGTVKVPEEFYAEVRVEECRVAFLCR